MSSLLIPNTIMIQTFGSLKKSKALDVDGPRNLFTFLGYQLKQAVVYFLIINQMTRLENWCPLITSLWALT